MNKIKNKLIKFLGGYTEKEMMRVENKYQGLLDSNTNQKNAQLCNEYIYRTLNVLDSYARQLYYEDLDTWTQKMYNVIHNNRMRIFLRYLYEKSTIIYKVDTTLETTDQFLKILSKEMNKDLTDEDIDDLYFILETD